MSARSPIEERVARVAQVIGDVSGDLEGARVLDLGCYNGHFALEAARLGAAEVVGIEGRGENLAEGIARRDAEGLTQVEFVEADVRTLTKERYGEFDVVLCLGILYHLNAPDVFEFAAQVASVCRGYALIETQIGLSRKSKVRYDGRLYEGFMYSEDTVHPGASLDNERSFWPTRSSLVNLLTDVGFTSIGDVLSPTTPSLMDYRDHVLLLAFKGQPRSAVERWPERYGRGAHPSQGARFRAWDRLSRLRGRGLPAFFR